ncbi:MAG: efflux RND transporter periplasmic adaptor subunit [Bacteroidales bacterium]|nr:efflux RND transporter periplasmic adaptor subunit [Bacteroidales bacterium]
MKTTINTLSIIFLLFVVASCQQEAQDPKQELLKLKTQLSTTQARISELETIIENDSNKVEAKTVFVDLLSIKADTFIHYISVTGSVESDNQAYISPEISGQIKKVLVHEGQKVKKGHALMILNSEITQKTINEVKTNLELARTVYKKQKELWDQNIGSEIQYLQAKNNMRSLEGKLETLQVQQRMATIRAPYDGTVDNIFQHEGEMASPGRQVLQLINLKNLKVYVNMSERYLPYVHKGDIAVVSFPTYPDLVIKAPLFRIGNMINPANRTVKVQINIKNKDGKLKPNLISKIKIKDYYNEKAIAVPSIIIKQDLKGDYVFLVVKNKKGSLLAKKQYIKTGVSHKAKSLVLEGLSPNDKVIYNGYNLVRNGSLIRVNNEL